MLGGRNGELQIISNASNGIVRTGLSGTGCMVPTPAHIRLGTLLCGF
jgi:hypothetical protein